MSSELAEKRISLINTNIILSVISMIIFVIPFYLFIAFCAFATYGPGSHGEQNILFLQPIPYGFYILWSIAIFMGIYCKITKRLNKLLTIFFRLNLISPILFVIVLSSIYSSIVH